MMHCIKFLLGCGSEVSHFYYLGRARNVSRHFGPESEVSWVRSVLGPNSEVSGYRALQTLCVHSPGRSTHAHGPRKWGPRAALPLEYLCGAIHFFGPLITNIFCNSFIFSAVFASVISSRTSLQWMLSRPVCMHFIGYLHVYSVYGAAIFIL